MNDRERLAGAVLCVGFDGDPPSRAPLDRLASLAPAGVVLFGRNVGRADDLRALTAAIVDRIGGALPPLVGVDQEGGRVARIVDGVPELASAMAFAAAGDVAATEAAATALGSALRGLGVTVDFAPCADLAIEPANTVIGARAYGDEPSRAAAHVAAFVRGLHAGGVIACAKHAPGHGGTAGDSHVELPVLHADRGLLERRELVPFAAAVDAGARMLMTAHIVVPAIDAERPATLSPAVIAYLRERLAYDGAIVSDCLTMSAVATQGIGRAAVAAIAAGVDLLIVSRLDAAFEVRDALIDAVSSGALSHDRLEEAASRIARIRASVPRASTGAGSGEAVALETARRAVTVVRGAARLRADLPVTVVSFEGKLGDGIANERGAMPSLSTALRFRRWKSEHLRVGVEPDDDELLLLLSLIASQGDRNVVVVARRAHIYPAQRRAIASILEQVPHAVVVSAREPFDLALFPQAQTVLAIYGDETVSFEGLADVLSGRAHAAGVLPVTLSSD